MSSGIVESHNVLFLRVPNGVPQTAVRAQSFWGTSCGNSTSFKSRRQRRVTGGYLGRRVSVASRATIRQGHRCLASAPGQLNWGGDEMVIPGDFAEHWCVLTVSASEIHIATSPSEMSWARAIRWWPGFGVWPESTAAADKSNSASPFRARTVPRHSRRSAMATVTPSAPAPQ
jgi:hypothetical protein